MRTVFRIALALALMVGFTSAATAQMTVAIGPKAGVNFANFTGDDVSGLDMRVSFAFGAAADVSITDMFAIHPEAYYSMQGTKESDTDTKAKLNYIRVPVLLKVTIPTEGNISPYLFAGPEFGFKVSCDFDVDGTTIDCDEALSDELGGNAEVKSFDYGAAFGAGVALQLGPGMLTIDGRYALGLADLVDVEGGEADVKNSNIHVAVGYLYTLGQ
jgi:hypothetical protein